MKSVYTINWEVAPKDWKGFKRWHTLACPSDPLTSEERFVKEGGQIPQPKKSKMDDNFRTTKKE